MKVHLRYIEDADGKCVGEVAPDRIMAALEGFRAAPYYHRDGGDEHDFHGWQIVRTEEGAYFLEVIYG